MSIKSKYSYYILSNLKKYEFRKMIPKWVIDEINDGGEVDVYVYVTRALPQLTVTYHKNTSDVWEKLYSLHGSFIDNANDIYNLDVLNGKVVCKFTLNEITLINQDFNKMKLQKLAQDGGLYLYDLLDYAGGKSFWSLKIPEIEVFDAPMELGEFYKTNIPYVGRNEIAYALEEYGYDKVNKLLYYTIKRAPQNCQAAYVRV